MVEVPPDMASAMRARLTPRRQVISRMNDSITKSADEKSEGAGDRGCYELERPCIQRPKTTQAAGSVPVADPESFTPRLRAPITNLKNTVYQQKCRVLKGVSSDG